MFHNPIDSQLLSNQASIRLFIKLDRPITPEKYGKVFFNGQHLGFGVTYTDTPENGEKRGQVAFIRGELCSELRFPEQTIPTTNYYQLLHWIHTTILENNILSTLDLLKN